MNITTSHTIDTPNHDSPLSFLTRNQINFVGSIKISQKQEQGINNQVKLSIDNVPEMDKYVLNTCMVTSSNDPTQPCQSLDSTNILTLLTENIP